MSTVTAKWLHPFERLTLVGDALLYIETGRLKTAEQAERFARMIDSMCDAADVVDSTPRPLRGVASHVTAPTDKRTWYGFEVKCDEIRPRREPGYAPIVDERAHA